MPAKAIGAKVQIIQAEQAERALLEPNDDTPFPWQLWQSQSNPDFVEARYPEQEGTAVFIRPDLPRAIHAQQMREQGILTVSEVDDNYLSNPRLSIFFRQTGFSKEERRAHLHALMSTDRIVFSTDLLRDLYVRYMKDAFNTKTKLLPEMFVCRNNIDVNDWPEPTPRKDRLRVGWMGSPSHVWDVDLCRPALMQAQAFGCSTHLIGYNPTEPNGPGLGSSWEGQSVASKRRIALWKQLRFSFTPWKPPSEFHREALPLDIGLCPLKDDEHTRGKSDVKFVEYSISGAAVIAQNTPVYSTTIVHGETGLLVNSPQEMVDAVKFLATEEDHRLRLVNNARKYIYEERGLKQMRDEWTAAVTA